MDERDEVEGLLSEAVREGVTDITLRVTLGVGRIERWSCVARTGNQVTAGKGTSLVEALCDVLRTLGVAA